MRVRHIKSQRGSGMIIAFFALLLLSILGVSLMSVSSQSLIVASRETLRSRALACAEAGVEQAISYLMAGGPDGSEPTEWRATSPTAPATLATGEQYTLTCKDGTTGGVCDGRIIIRSTGTVTEGGRSTSETVEVVVKLDKENVNVWNNVIFGGVGQAGKSINGNVAIRGSVHLLGDGEEFTDLDGDGRWDTAEPYTDTNHNGQYDNGEPFIDVDLDGHRDPTEPFNDVNGNGTRDPALTVTDMASEISGNADMGNSYLGMSSDLRPLLPAIEQTMYGGEMVESLEAKLRVKHGRVNISGVASVGFQNDPGNSLKETVDGTYVSDGFGGNKGAASVYSDNGPNNGYDLGDGLVTMPIVDTGSYTADGVSYGNYLQYLQAHAQVHTGNLNLQNGTPFSISGPNGSLTMDASGNMTISGIVYVTGDISFGPSKSRITYSGHGTLVTPGSTFAHCDVLPRTNFPRNDALGLICGDRIELANGSGDAQLTMALAMYAQHRVICPKQSQIAGTIVASYYEMKNVPRIFQVPELADNLPPGMPGADPIWIVSIDIESWRKA